MIKKMSILGVCTIVALVTVTACSDDGNTIQITKHELQPLVKINLSTEQQIFVNKTNDFAFNLASTIEGQEVGNMNVSPIGTAYILGMLLNGANGNSQSQIANAIGFENTNTGEVNVYFQKLSQGATDVDKSVKIYVANSVICDKAFGINTAFKDAVAYYYDAKVDNYDFASDDVAGIINAWVKEKTNGIIPELISEVDANTQMYALNAIYFKGVWSKEFDSQSTKSETFMTEDGSATLVSMMQDERTILYYENETFSMIQLPYGNGGWSMQILLPSEGNSVSDVLASLDGARWKTALERMENFNVDLILPRFEINNEIQMKESLQALGIKDIFDPYLADFSRLSDHSSYLTKFIQKIHVSVDEKGTETTTATMALNGATAPGPNEKAVFHADRPFIFLITENPTGTVYFIGTKKI